MGLVSCLWMPASMRAGTASSLKTCAMPLAWSSG
jgi:hypothetical protein